MSPSPIARDLVVAHTRALKLPGIARVFEAHRLSEHTEVSATPPGRAAP
jgi:hypothetical protein